MIKLKCDIETLRITWSGRCLYFLSLFRKSTARKNIALIFQQTLSSSEKRRFTVAYYSHMMRSLKEIFLLTWLNSRQLEQRVQIIGIEHLHQAVDKGKGVIMLTGHFGSWEFTPLFFLRKAPQYKSRYYCVRKSLRFAFLDHIFLSRYEKAGCQIINKKNALKRVYSALKKQGLVLFPFDLRPPPHTKNKLKTNFLGQETTTYASIAFLTERLKSPVISVTSYRLNNKQQVIEFYPEVKWQFHEDKQHALLYNTQCYNDRLEEMLLAHPVQWLWSYNRW